MAKFSFKKSIFNDRFVFAMSLVLAVILWIFVSISFSPTVTKEVGSVPVSISLEDSSFEGAKLFGSEDFVVQVRVQGKKYVTDSVSADDIIVTANVGQIVGTGVNTLELSAESVGSDEFEILSISPSSLVVFVDYEDQKTIDVEVEYKGVTVSQENYFLEASVADAYKTVTVSGAKSEVQSVARAVAVADVNAQLDSSQIFKGDIKLFDSAGKEITLDYSTLSFTSADVMVGVKEQINLPLTITPLNAPENLPNIEIFRIVNNRPTKVDEITVKRDPTLVDTLNEISLGIIDFSKLDKSVRSWSFEFTLPSIGGISYPNISSASDAVFKVVITADKLYAKTFDISKSSIQISGLSEGLKASIQTEGLQGVTVISTQNAQLNRLKSADITAVVDVSSLEKGSHSCNKVSFKIKDNPDCWVVIPSDASFDVAVKIE